MRPERLVLFTLGLLGCFVGDDVGSANDEITDPVDGGSDVDTYPEGCEGCMCAALEPSCDAGLVCDLGTCMRPGMVWIAEGSFVRGCEGIGCLEDERPERELWLAGFGIDRREVTVADYTACMTATSDPCSQPEGVWDGDSPYAELFNFGAPDREQHPINGVTWSQATFYCERLGKRLPTEAEWEKAARGPAGVRYPWGNAAPTCTRAHLDIGGPGCGTDHTIEAGALTAGATNRGIVDLSGNTIEWTADYYDAAYYADSPALNPKGPVAGTYRSIRGGSWHDAPDRATTTARAHAPPEIPSVRIGFRCASGALE